MVKKLNLREKTIFLQKQIDTLNDKWKRALADYQNLERRIKQEKKDFFQFSNASLIDKLLVVLDDLERTYCHFKNKGLALAINQFSSILKTEGLKEIKALGKEFDPVLMDCFEVVDGKNNIVVEVVQKGYFLKNKVLRPAKVKVGQSKNKKGDN